MRDIVVTTPKSEMANAAKEAADCIATGGGDYFRSIRSKPTDFGPGQRVFYVEDGYIRGFAVCSEVRGDPVMRCDSTGRTWGGQQFVIMPAESWKWIKPIPCKGFQGWRYSNLKPEDIQIVGDWKSPRPQT